MEDWTGVLRMDVEDRSKKSVARKMYFQGALKVMRPIYHDDSGQVCYYILNPGGGYLDGDRYHMHISLKENAKLTLTTQSATKVYKTLKTHAYQETEFHLKSGSYLEYLPDPLIAYKHARYKQKNRIHMEKGATLIYSDIITPGWSPDSQLFSYKLLQLINEVYMDEELVLFDHIKLEPSSQKMNGMGFMEGFTHMGSMIVVGEKTDSKLIDRLYDAIHDKSNKYKMGISQLPVSGFTLRIFANSTQVIERAFNECHHIIKQEWFQSSPSSLRKY